METVEVTMKPEEGGELIVTDANRLEMVRAMLGAVGCEFLEQANEDGSLTYILREKA